MCALLAIASVWLLWLSRARAAEAALRYGRNTDSGVLEFAVGIAYLLPATVLFGVAAVAEGRAWRARRLFR